MAVIFWPDIEIFQNQLDRKQLENTTMKGVNFVNYILDIWFRYLRYTVQISQIYSLDISDISKYDLDKCEDFYCKTWSFCQAQPSPSSGSAEFCLISFHADFKVFKTLCSVVVISVHSNQIQLPVLGLQMCWSRPNLNKGVWGNRPLFDAPYFFY